MINYDMPDTADAYIHRIGRTGRAKRNGEAFTLCTPQDKAMIKQIERIMKEQLPRTQLNDFDYSTPQPDYGQNRAHTKSNRQKSSAKHKRTYAN